MNNVSVKKFQSDLQTANGDKAKMEKVFKSITEYLDSSLPITEHSHDLEDYLDKNPRLKKIREWSGTVLVNSDYELVNF